MIEVTKRFRFSAAHRLTDTTSPCRNNHGHNFYVEVTCRRDGGGTIGGGAKDGMVVEFADVTWAWREGIEPLVDHQDLNEALQEDLKGKQPTTERVAWWLLMKFRSLNVPAVKVRLWETEDNSAIATLEP